MLISISSVRCIRLARFENDRTISFIPHDGTFDLMNYRLSTQVCSYIQENAVVVKSFKFCYEGYSSKVGFISYVFITLQVKPLIWVEAQVEKHSRSRVEYLVRAHSQYKDRRFQIISLAYVCLF
jgi:AP-1 complex subunit mu